MIRSPQSATGKECVCDLKNVDPLFPKDELTKVETTALKCIRSITSERVNILFKHVSLYFILNSFSKFNHIKLIM